MADIRSTEIRTEQDFVYNAAGAPNATSDREQPETTAENAVKRIKTKGPKVSGKRIILLTALIAFLGTSGTLAYMISSGYHFFYVQGNSMAPTLSDGDTVLIKKDNDLAKSQVVVFRFPEQWENPFNEDSLLIKRVIAVEGDTFSYSGRVFTVNGKKYPLPDNYNCKTEKTTYTKTLGKNEMIVFGDNVSQSADSRFFYCRDNTEGFIVSTDLIVSSGRIVFDF